MRYDARNASVILGLHPATQHKCWQAIEELELIGEDCLFVSGYRTLDEQWDEWIKGRLVPGKIVTHARPGWSFHNYGLAIDVVPVGPLGIEFSERNLLEWAAIGRYETYGRIFQEAGFQWGYQLWGYDRPHFHYTRAPVDPGTVSESSRNLSILEVRDGALPDVEVARQERRTALIERLDMAKKALLKPWMGGPRRRALVRFITKMEERLAEI